MTTARSEARDEAQIRTLIEERAEAVCVRDGDRVTSCIAPDTMLFDVVNSLRSIGTAGCRQPTEA